MTNICSSLLVYNGSSTSQFIPVAATQVPSLANGEISPDFATYTFQIRTGLKFSNGDPLTAYDVWYSMVRLLLFDLTPVQYLIPGATGAPIMTAANDTTGFNAVMNAVSYNNSTDTITFKLVRPIAPTLFFNLVGPAWVSIIDSRWLEEVGAGITFTPDGFYVYQNQGNFGSYNLKVQWDPIGSGPYMIQNYVPGQSVTLVPNPEFPGVTGIPVVNNTVVIQWVKDPETAYNLFTSGQDDIVSALLPFATEYLSPILKQVASGKAAVYQSPSLSSWFFMFNIDINATAMKADFGAQYHVPSDYFANLQVREAFAYAFDYSTYLNEIVGNQKYGLDFGSSYAGAIIPGVPYHVPPSQLQNIPTYDLAKAKQLLQQSGEYDTSINIPIVTYAGDTDSVAAIQMWAAALNSIDPNITINPLPLPITSIRAYPTATPCRAINDLPGSPYPSYFVDSWYEQGGWYTAMNGWTVQYLNQTGHADQAKIYANLNSLIQAADSTTNATLAGEDYTQAEQIAINLYMCVYLYVSNQFIVVKPYMNGYQGQISFQENPMVYPIGLYYWWVKTCGSAQACTGRNIGP